VRAYGAGILSSPGERPHSVNSSQPQRFPLGDKAELLHCVASTCKIDMFQSRYFVIESFEALLSWTTPDLTPHYRALSIGVTDEQCDSLQGDEFDFDRSTQINDNHHRCTTIIIH
jgi:phenylalanine-4-hydroxylase